MLKIYISCKDHHGTISVCLNSDVLIDGTSYIKWKPKIDGLHSVPVLIFSGLHSVPVLIFSGLHSVPVLIFSGLNSWTLL